MAFFWSTPGPGPCPACDVELGELDQERPATCPACGQRLQPVHVASAKRRIGAFALDSLVLLATAGPLSWLLFRVVGLDPLVESRGVDALLQILAGDLWRPVGRTMPFAVMATTYFLLFGMLRGQTPGQRWLGIAVVDARGEQPTITRAFARVLLGWLSLATAGLGALWMLFDQETRALHDHLASTWVIRGPASAS